MPPKVLGSTAKRAATPHTKRSAENDLIQRSSKRRPGAVTRSPVEEGQVDYDSDENRGGNITVQPKGPLNLRVLRERKPSLPNPAHIFITDDEEEEGAPAQWRRAPAR